MSIQEYLAGQAVIVRTVTFFYTGRVAAPSDQVDDRFVRLEDAAWIADTGRWAKALEEGNWAEAEEAQTEIDAEIEPYPGECWVAVGAIVDVSPWPHELPRETR